MMSERLMNSAMQTKISRAGLTWPLDRVGQPVGQLQSGIRTALASPAVGQNDPVGQGSTSGQLISRAGILSPSAPREASATISGLDLRSGLSDQPLLLDCLKATDAFLDCSVQSGRVPEQSGIDSSRAAGLCSRARTLSSGQITVCRGSKSA